MLNCILNNYGVEILISLMWLGTGSRSERLLKLCWTFEFYKRREISFLAEPMLAYLEGLHSMYVVYLPETRNSSQEKKIPWVQFYILDTGMHFPVIMPSLTRPSSQVILSLISLSHTSHTFHIYLIAALKYFFPRLASYILSCVSVTIGGVQIGNWIYYILTDRNYKYLQRYR